MFFNYNYYNNIGTGGGLGVGDVNAHREVFGFEKTFLDGNASIGLRAPLFQTTGDSSFKRSDFGDLSVVFKYAFINDCQTGDVLSGGLVVTVPTGEPGLPTLDGGSIHDVLLQPWVGGFLACDRMFFQGFSSVVVPTDSRDVTLMLNDIGFGYYLHKGEADSFLTAIIPVTELHVTTPLNHRGVGKPRPSACRISLT